MRYGIASMKSIWFLQWCVPPLIMGVMVDGGRSCTDSHSECPINQYCAHGESRRSYCMNCDDCHYNGDENVDLFEAVSPCPTKCSCESNQDCDAGSFCDNGYGSGRDKVCTECEYCSFNGETGADCASVCSCSTSSDCGVGSFCLRDFYDQNTAGEGICINCFSGSCIEDNLFDQSELCQDLCPAQHECSEHQHCGTEGQWCSKDHKCHACSEDCWSIFGAYDGAEPFWWELEGISIDFSCPKECCNWGMNFDLGSEWDTKSYFKVGPCNPNLQIDGYFTLEEYPDWGPLEFQKYGNQCVVNRYVTENGYPQVVTIVNCEQIELFGTCGDSTSSLALLATDETTNATAFLDDDSFPHTAHYGRPCYNDDLYRPGGYGEGGFFFSIIMFIIVFVLICPCICAMFRMKRHYEDISSRPSPVVAVVVPEQAPKVPRADVIDAMFPTQQRFTEEMGKDDNQCTICLQDIEPGDTILTGGSCDHFYHRDCITLWLKCKNGNDHCPNCRCPMWTTEAFRLAESALLSDSGSSTGKSPSPSNAGASRNSASGNPEASRSSSPLTVRSSNPLTSENFASSDAEDTANPASGNVETVENSSGLTP